MDYPEHGYLFTSYVTREYLPEVYGYRFTCFMQATRNHRAAKIRWLLPHDSWKLMTQEQKSLLLYLSKTSRVIISRSAIPIYQQTDSNSIQYVIILSKDINKTRTQRQDNHTDQDESNDKTFKMPSKKMKIHRKSQT